MNVIKKYLSPIVTVIVLLLFGVYLYKNPQIIDELLSTNIIYITLVMLVYLMIFFLEGLFILVSLKIFEKDISKKESYFLATVSRIGNYLLPMRAGAIFRATYLKKKYSFSYSNFLSTLYGYYIIIFFTNALVALIVLFFKNSLYSISSPVLSIFFLVIVLVMLILIFLRFPFEKIIKRKNGFIFKVLSFLDRFIKGWDLIVKERKAFLMLLFIALGNIFLNIVVAFIEFNAIGKLVNLLDVILYTCISGVSLLISITPGSLGIREGAFIITSKSIGLSEVEIMKLAFLDRGIMFVLLLLCLIVVLFFDKKLTLKGIFFGEKDKQK